MLGFVIFQSSLELLILKKLCLSCSALYLIFYIIPKLRWKKQLIRYSEGQTWTVRRTGWSRQATNWSVWTPVAHLHWPCQARKNGTGAASGAEAQRDLVAPNLEMTHTSGERLWSFPVLHPFIHLFLPVHTVTQPAWRGSLCLSSNKQEMTDCLIQCKKHPLSIYQLPGSGLGTAVFSKTFPDLSSSPSGGKTGSFCTMWSALTKRVSQEV